MDTYGCGCQHDCAYCYARSLLDFRGLWNPERPAVADIEKVRKKIRTLTPGTIVRLGGMTDCFQPIEKTQRVTYETIKALNARGVGYLIVAKNRLVGMIRGKRVTVCEDEDEAYAFWRDHFNPDPNGCYDLKKTFDIVSP